MVNGGHKGPEQLPQMQVKSPTVTDTRLPTLRYSVSSPEAGVYARRTDENARLSY